MTNPPARPKIYHITHIDNLASIVDVGGIESDSRRFRQGQNQKIIGMPEIKRRRLFEIEVTCHTGTKVGDYVPFYFCSRSIMLYIIYRGNHTDITYRDGQRPILHLQVDMGKVVDWANRHNVKWVFTDRNAGTFFTDFYNNLEQLDQIDWNAVNATDFRNRMISEGKQAEFLVHAVFPWHLVEKIGVIDTQMLSRVETILQSAAHKPVVQVEPSWYY